MADMIVNEFQSSIGEQNGSQMRWAYTALSLENKDIAIEDEILIDKKTGRIYYKRLDGKIVTYEQPFDISSANALTAELYTSMTRVKTAGTTLIVNKKNDDYLVKNAYSILSFGSTREILAPITVTGLAFKLSLKENFFAIKINARDTDKAIIDILTVSKLSGAEKASETEFTNAVVNATITVHNTKTGVTTQTAQTVDFSLKIDSLGLCVIPDTLLANPYDTRFAEVTINSITFPKFATLTKAEIDTLLLTPSLAGIKNEDNQVLLNDIDIISFIDDARDIDTGNGVKTKTVLLTNLVFTEMEYSTGLTVEERIEVNNLKNQVTAIPLVKMANTKPVDIRDGDVWIEPIKTINAVGAVINNASTTFVKDTVEKYLVSKRV